MLPTPITSRNNPTVKWLASLSEKKYREESQCFLIEGRKLIIEAIRGGAELTHLILREGENEPFYFAEYRVKHSKTQFLVLGDSCFEKISQEKAPEGVCAVVKYLDFFKYYNIIYRENFFGLDMNGVVLLDTIQDPGNLGAILRSAAAFGVTDVILTENSVDVYHPRVIRASMGALFHLRLWQTPNLYSAVQALQANGHRVFSAERRPNAIPVHEAHLTPADAIVIGNEGHGISREVSLVSDGSVYLPISQKVESLNASVAASLLIWEQMKAKE